MKVAREKLKRILVRCMLLVGLVLTPGVALAQYGGPVYGPTEYGGNMSPMSADVFNWMPGRMWFEFNLADEGFGYSGPYGTIGLKTHLGEDLFDGRWLFEHQSHLAIDEANYFANFGVMRVISLHSANADVTTGFWVDHDGDEQGDFAHTFNQLSFNASVKTERMDVVLNGYYPVGSTDFAIGDPTGNSSFQGNFLVLQAGIDSALQGYDATVRLRPQSMAFINGVVELGGYGYESELIDQFAGFRARFGMQALKGGLMSFEINNDDRFGTTGAIQLAYQFGVNARGTEYGLTGRDLEPTVRNDHIIRFQQDFIPVVDPDTGLAYNVIHVDNTVGAGGLGSFESPFDSLAAAEAASGTDDIIFVNVGDGTSTNYNTGIALKAGQFLLGDGVEHLVPMAGGGLFRLSNTVNGVRPEISGPVNAVTLADRNTVRGFVIDNDTGTMLNGIFHGGGGTITDGVIEQISLFNAINNGVSLDGIAGDWTFFNNDFTNTGDDGIFIDNAMDSTSTFTFNQQTFTGVGRDGIHMEDYDGTTFAFSNISATNSFRDGVRMERYINAAGTPGTLSFLNTVMNTNIGRGIHINDFDGNVSILNNDFQTNIAGGIQLTNVRNTDPATMTLIGTATLGDTSQFLGNGVGGGPQIGIDLTDPGAIGRVMITNSILTDSIAATNILNVGVRGAIGIRSTASGNGTSLTTSVVNNALISDHTVAGVIFNSTNGASHTVSLFNTDGTIINMDDNGLGGGFGIQLNAGSPNGGTEATLTAAIRDIQMNNTTILTGTALQGNTILTATSNNDGVIDLDFRNVAGDLQNNGLVMNFDNDGAGGINRIVADNLNFTTLTNSGAVLSTGTDTRTSFFLSNSNFLSDGASVGSTGVDVTADGANNQTQISLNNNTFDSFDAEGVDINVDNGARLLANIAGNTITNNGQGGRANGTFPFFDGVNITADNGSTANVRFDNNIVTGSGDIGLELGALNGSDINILMTNNNLSGNDLGEDGVDDPVINAGIADFAATADGAGSNICLAISNNFFGLQPGALVSDNIYGIRAVNGATGLLENDPGTNGPTTLATAGGVAIGVFSTVCTPAIQAEELAFLADGFPPF